MPKFTIPQAEMSSGQDEYPSERAEVRVFHHNALNVLGPDYLIRKWLPYKGPAFACLIMAMRKHIFYDYTTGEQRTRYFPEAATIAQLAGISRAQVFRLLNDPDMELFIKRINRRRYSPEHQKEVQTSNLYLVSMDDPPIPEDVHLVEEEQRRIDAMERGEDPDAPRSSRSIKGKSSESQFETLIAVSNRDSHSSIKLRLEDRITINNIDGKDTSITKSEPSENIAHLTIGSEQVRTLPTKQSNQTRQTLKQERSADQPDQVVQSAQNQNREADQIAIKPEKEVPQNRELGQIFDTVPPLSESENWKAQARGWLAATRLPARIGQPQGQTIIEHHMSQFQVENTPAAVEALLNYAAPILAKYQIPVETLETLAEQARRRTTMYVHKINADGSAATTNPGGYFLNVLKSVISEFGKARDLAKLDRKTAQMEAMETAHDRVAHGLPARIATKPATLADAFRQQRPAAVDPGRSPEARN